MVLNRFGGGVGNVGDFPVGMCSGSVENVLRCHL